MTDTPFRTPDEWRRAREAVVDCCQFNTDSDQEAAELFESHYPCPPEPDRAAHHGRTTRHWEPGLGPCVCEVCRTLPDHLPPEPGRAEDERVLEARSAARENNTLLNALLTAVCNLEKCWNEETDADYAAARAAVLARMQHPDTRPAPAEVERAVEELEDALYFEHCGRTDTQAGAHEKAVAARAALLALYAEPVPASRTDGAAGEVFEVEMHTTVGLDGWYGANCVWLPESYAPGQRVRVTRVEGEA